MKNLLFLILLLSPARAISQSFPQSNVILGGNYQYLNTPNWRAGFTCDGQITAWHPLDKHYMEYGLASRNTSYSNALHVSELPLAAQGPHLAPISVSGIAVSGEYNGTSFGYLHSSTYYASDFLPGPSLPIHFLETPAYLSRWNRLWRITRLEVLAFTQEFQAGTVDLDNYPSIRDWPAHGNTEIGEPEFIAPFVDLNVNGLYEPNLGEYPAFPGSQALFTVMHTPPLNQLDGYIWRLDFFVMHYTYACGGPELERTYFSDIRVFNRSEFSVSNFRLSLDHLPLIHQSGGRLGTDTLLNTVFAFVEDELFNNAQGKKATWGCVLLDGPPAVGPDGRDNNRNGIVDEPNETVGMYASIPYSYYQNLHQDPQKIIALQLGLTPTAQPLYCDFPAGNGNGVLEPGEYGSPTRYIFPAEIEVQNEWSNTEAYLPYTAQVFQSYDPVLLTNQATYRIANVYVHDSTTPDRSDVNLLKVAISNLRQWYADGADAPTCVSGTDCFPVVTARPVPYSYLDTSTIGFIDIFVGHHAHHLMPLTAWAHSPELLIQSLNTAPTYTRNDTLFWEFESVAPNQLKELNLRFFRSYQQAQRSASFGVAALDCSQINYAEYDITSNLNIAAPTTVGNADQANSANGWRCYPNPSTGLLNVQMANPIAHGAVYQLLNSTGQTVATGTLPAQISHHTLNFQGIAAGNYILSIQAGDQPPVRQLVMLLPH